MGTALITGATGFIGANLARVLLERGSRVKALVRSNSDRSNIDGLDLEICTGDIRDPEPVAAALKGVDDVYHVAADYNFWSKCPETTYQNNVNGTANVLEACLKQGVRRVVYTSTVGVLGLAGLPKPCDETTLITPDPFEGPYKRSKREAERIALGFARRGLPLVVVNPSAPVGQWDRKPTPTGKIIVDFISGKIPAYLDTGLNLIHARDVAVGHVLAAEKGRVGERYVLGNRNLSLNEIFGLLSRISGKSAPKLKIPYRLAWIAGFASTKVSDWITGRPPLVALEAVKMARRHMYFDASKAVRELGLPQTPVENALEDAVEWFSRRGYLN